MPALRAAAFFPGPTQKKIRKYLSALSLRASPAVDMAGDASVLQGGLQVHKTPSCSRRIGTATTVERNDLAVLQEEYITAGCVDILRCWRQRPSRKLEGAIVCPLRRQLDNNDVIVDVEVVQLSVHVRERGLKVDSQANVRATVFFRHPHRGSSRAFANSETNLAVSFDAASAR
jgi:hypothetical protein